jgi:hypothetical protein
MIQFEPSSHASASDLQRRHLRAGSEDRRHNFLSLYGPLSMVWLLVVWASGLVAGFGTLYWALDSGESVRLSWPNQIYFSGAFAA